MRLSSERSVRKLFEIGVAWLLLLMSLVKLACYSVMQGHAFELIKVDPENEVIKVVCTLWVTILLEACSK